MSGRFLASDRLRGTEQPRPLLGCMRNGNESRGLNRVGLAQRMSLATQAELEKMLEEPA